MKRLVALSLLIASASCAAPSADFMAHYGSFDIDGDLGIATGGVTAQNDLKDTGFKDDKDVIGGRADIKFGGPHLSVWIQDSSHDGSGTLTADVSADGNTITAGTGVNSDLDLGLYTAILTWDILPTDVVELGFGVGLTVMDIDASITDPLAVVTVSADETIPIPLLAVQAAGAIGPIEAEGVLSGMAFEYEGDDLTYVQFDVLGRWRFVKAAASGALVVGYRLVDFDLEYEDGGDDVDADITFSGPFVGLNLGI